MNIEHLCKWFSASSFLSLVALQEVQYLNISWTTARGQAPETSCLAQMELDQPTSTFQMVIMVRTKSRGLEAGEIMRKNRKDAKSFPFWSQVFSFPSFEENHVVAILQLADLTFQVARAVAPGASCGCQMVSEKIAVKNVRDRQSIPESRVV